MNFGVQQRYIKLLKKKAGYWTVIEFRNMKSSSSNSSEIYAALPARINALLLMLYILPNWKYRI